MRDIGALLWVVIVVAGVISSIVSNARKQAARSQPVPAGRAPQPRPQAPLRTAPAAVRPPPPRPQPLPPSPAPAAAPEELPHPAVTQRRRARMPLFGTRAAVVRAVVAAEVLGKPRALRDEY